MAMSFEEWEAARSASARLRHDLGRAVTFGAEEMPERETTRLRQRLAGDGLRTRRGPDGVRSAAEIFDSLAGERRTLCAERGWAQRVEVIAAAVEDLRRNAGRIDRLSREELLALDRCARTIDAESAALDREVRAARPEGK